MSKHEDIEIEAKFEVLDINSLKQWLLKFTTFDEEIKMVDDYYIPAHRDFLAVEYPYEWLRLRTDSKGSSINYKYWYPPNEPESTHCDEFETSVADASKMKMIFKSLDINKVATVDKHRTVYNAGNMEFALDHIKDLGWYLEIEYKGTELNIVEVNEEFKKLFKQLKEFLGDRNYRGYPYMILEKNGYFQNK